MFAPLIAPNPSMSASGVTSTGATLAIANHAGDWYVKKTSPTPEGACSDAISGATHAVDSLTPGETYTYKAYSDSTCATEIGSATFTALKLAASRVADTTARLTLSGHTGSWYVKKTSPTPEGTCSTAISGTTHDLSTLTRSTAYTYKAYSDTTCVTELASVSFTTLTSSLTASGVTDGAARLTVGNHTGNWYVKKTAPTPAGACSSAISGTTHDLSSLTPGVAYTYTAYSDSSCAASVASETFTAIKLAASVVADTTATLTGRTGNWYVKETSPATGAACSAAISGATHDLTGLTRSIAYTYKAYSDSGCSTAIATATFTTLVSSLAASGLASSTATITIGNHSGDWYVKETSPATGAACSAAISGTAHDLDSLTRNTAYVYQAYSDSACATAIGLVAFTTLQSSLTASAVTQNSATLTIGSHTGSWYVKKTAPEPAGSCSSAVSGATRNMSSLTPGTPHVYLAYSASGCADANLVARGSFTTGGVSVGNLGEKQGPACTVSNTQRCAQEFTTGSSAGGYTLHSVATVFNVGKATPAFTLALHKASGGKRCLQRRLLLRLIHWPGQPGLRLYPHLRGQRLRPGGRYRLLHRRHHGRRVSLLVVPGRVVQ